MLNIDKSEVISTIYWTVELFCINYIIIHHELCYIWTAIILEDLDTSEELSHSAADDSMSSTISSNSNFMKLPVEEDFDYIKQISNGAYGYVCVL